MKVLSKTALVAASIVCFSTNAFAVPFVNCTSTVELLTETSSGASQAHGIGLASCTALAGCTTGYPTLYRAFLDFEDKDLFARAMLAQSKAATVTVRVELGLAARVTNHGNLTCKVISIW